MTQLRRNVPPALRSLFNSGAPLITAELITVTLSGGVQLRWTDFAMPVSIGSTIWDVGPGVMVGKRKWVAGIEVDTLHITLLAQDGTLINGQAMMPFINGGGLDGAKVQAWRAYAALPTLGSASAAWVDKLHRFTGQVSDIDRPSRIEAAITVRSIFEMLNQPLPRNVYEPQCSSVLYDSSCGVNRAARTVHASVSTANDPLRLKFTSETLGQVAGYFDLGAVRFTSGGNAGVLRTVRHFAVGEVTLVQPLPVQAAMGDTFDIYPGCDGSRGTCQGKYGNELRFGGQPYIPVSETVL